VWDTRGIPLKYVLPVIAVVLVLTAFGSPEVWRIVEDAFSPGDRHARLTRDEALERAIAKVNGYLDRRGRTTVGSPRPISVLHEEATSGLVRGWCRDCDQWLVELVHEDERFCVAVTEQFSAFSSGCSRWELPAEPPPLALVAAARAKVAPGRGAGTLLFQRRNGDTADIYALDIARDRLRRLTATPEHEFSPAWSPDGTRIAFARNLGGSEHDVFVMNADGSGIARLTTAPNPDDRPAWLPDGRLAFQSVRDGIGSTYVLDLAKPNVPPKRILVRTSSAEWSPNGKAIAFAAPIEHGFDIWLTDAKARGRWNLTSGFHEDAYRPRWSPDGTRIAFATTSGIYVMRADGRGRRRVVSKPHELALAWSPNGTSIAWVGAIDNGGMYVTSTKTGRTRRLTSGRWDLAPDWR
jgi:Tol biopolymer transport system component